MRCLPPYDKEKIRYTLIPLDVRRAVSKRFHNELFGPLLKKNGFVRKGASWFRVLNGEVVQGIKLDMSTTAKYYDDMKVMYDLYCLTHEHNDFPPGSFISLQQQLTGFIYPGAEDDCSHTTYTPFDADGNPDEEHAIHVISPMYRSFFYITKDIEFAQETEYEFFCEHTLPELDRIKDARSMVEKELELRKDSPFLYEDSCWAHPVGIDLYLTRGDWHLAEKALNVALQDEERMGRPQKGFMLYYAWYKEALDHVVLRDEEWLSRHFQENIIHNWKTIERCYPRLYKKYHPDTLPIHTSKSVADEIEKPRNYIGFIFPK